MSSQLEEPEGTGGREYVRMTNIPLPKRGFTSLSSHGIIISYDGHLQVLEQAICTTYNNIFVHCHAIPSPTIMLLASPISPCPPLIFLSCQVGKSATFYSFVFVCSQAFTSQVHLLTPKSCLQMILLFHPFCTISLYIQLLMHAQPPEYNLH